MIKIHVSGLSLQMIGQIKLALDKMGGTQNGLELTAREKDGTYGIAVEDVDDCNKLIDVLQNNPSCDYLR